MSYCDECKKKNNWYWSMSRSFGPCEVCGTVAICYDVASKFLPAPPGKS